MDPQAGQGESMERLARTPRLGKVAGEARVDSWTWERRDRAGSHSPDDLLVRLEGRMGKGGSWQEIKSRSAGHQGDI